jgi:hypothetical protein
MIKSTPTHNILAPALARAIDMPLANVARFALERRLPFFAGTCGFGISRSDLPLWLAVAAKARAEKTKSETPGTS